MVDSQAIKRFCEAHIASGVVRIMYKDAVLFEYSVGYSDWKTKTGFVLRLVLIVKKSAIKQRKALRAISLKTL